MLVHHSLNYYPIGFPLIKYMRFVTGSFIFIAGFIITHFYITKYDLHEKTMYIRLFTRAIKLLLIFTVLNILIMMLLNNGLQSNAFDWSRLIHSIADLYIFGNYEMFYFDLLVPIAYVLMFTCLLIFILKRNFNLLKYITLALIIYCSFRFFNNDGGYYLRYTTIGLIGASIGLIQHNKLEMISNYWLLIVVLYLIHILLLPIIKLYYPLYILIVILNLLFFYTLGMQIKQNNRLTDKIILLGKYSLISYIFQIAILQVLKRIMDFSFLGVNKTFIAFILATLTTYLFIEFVDYLRRYSDLINKMYNLVFA